MQNYSHENMDNVFMKIIYISVVFVHGISGFYDDFKPKNIEVSFQARSLSRVVESLLIFVNT